MTTRPRPRKRRRPLGRILVALGSLGIAFVAGIGLGEALHDNPSAGGSQTVVRTLKPLTVPALTSETGMVTTSNH